MPTWNRNRLTSKLGIKLSIIQGPLADCIAKIDGSGLQFGGLDRSCTGCRRKRSKTYP